MEVLKLETWEQLFDPEVINLDKVQFYLDLGWRKGRPPRLKGGAV